MSSIIIRHCVADFDVWKTAFDAHGTVRRDYGLVDTGLLSTNDTGRARVPRVRQPAGDDEPDAGRAGDPPARELPAQLRFRRWTPMV